MKNTGENISSPPLSDRNLYLRSNVQSFDLLGQDLALRNCVVRMQRLPGSKVAGRNIDNSGTEVQSSTAYGHTKQQMVLQTCKIENTYGEMQEESLISLRCETPEIIQPNSVAPNCSQDTHELSRLNQTEKASPESLQFIDICVSQKRLQIPTAVYCKSQNTNENAKILINIHTESLKFVKAPDDPLSFQESSGENSSTLFNIEFKFDCEARCAITIMYFCTKNVTSDGLTYVPQDPSMNSQTYIYESGANQIFLQEDHIFDPAKYPEERLLYLEDIKIIPIVIFCSAKDNDLFSSHVTAAIVKKQSEAFILKLYEQKDFKNEICNSSKDVYLDSFEDETEKHKEVEDASKINNAGNENSINDGKNIDTLEAISSNGLNSIAELISNEFSCIICGKVLRSLYNVTHHNAEHSKNKEFPCSICGKIFASRYHVKRHLSVHIKRKLQVVNESQETLKHKKNVTINDDEETESGYSDPALSSGNGDTGSDLASEDDCGYPEDKIKAKSLEMCVAVLEDSDSKEINLRSFRKPNYFSKTNIRPRLHCSECDFNCKRRFNLVKHIFSLHKKFYCNLCGLGFTKNYNLNKHKLRHVNGIIKEFYCNFCGVGFAKSSNMKRHELRCHIRGTAKVKENKKLRKGVISMEDSETRKIALRNFRNMTPSKFNTKPFKCPKCTYAGIKLSDLSRHFKMIHDRYQLKCSRCNFTCELRNQLVDHIYAVHDHLEQLSCSMCEFTCSMKDGLTSHILSVHKLEELKCSQCEFACSDKHELLQHVLSLHENMSYFKCSQCDFSCNMKYKLNEHRLTVHYKDVKKCPYCEYFAPKKCAIDRHILKVHEKVKATSCSLCSYQCGSTYVLNKHIDSVHHNPKSYRCSSCDITCKSKHSLNEHRNTVHRKLGPFNCSRCNYVSNHKQFLSRHIMNVHEKIKPFKCSQCDYACCKKSALNFHVLAVHLKVKDVKCPDCDYKCTNQLLLYSHIKSLHTKLKPFKCVHCNYATSRNNYLTLHIKSVHDKTRDFKCPYCSLTTCRNDNLKAHIARTHKIHKELEPNKEISTAELSLSNCPERGDNILDHFLSDLIL